MTGSTLTKPMSTSLQPPSGGLLRLVAKPGKPGSPVKARQQGSSTPSPGCVAKRTYTAVCEGARAVTQRFGRDEPGDQASVRLVVGQPTRAVEDRKPAIRVFVHAHAHLDEVTPVALLGNLQHAVLAADRVVLPDHALLLDAQDVVERPDVGHEGPFRPRQP